MRLFIGAPVPSIPPLLDALAEVQSLWPRIRPVPPSNLHITLKFLGEVEEQRIPKIALAVREALGGAGHFIVSFSGLDVFPSARSAHILWTRVDAGRDALGRLADGLEEALASLGFKREEKPFIPHLTVGRFPKGYSPRLDLGGYARRSFGGFQANRVSLMKSSLSCGSSPVYTPLQDFLLK